MAIEVFVKKWGNSMGVILPKEVVEREHLKENQKIFVEIVKESDLTDMFGILPRKMSGQKFKDMVRKGWEN